MLDGSGIGGFGTCKVRRGRVAGNEEELDLRAGEVMRWREDGVCGFGMSPKRLNWRTAVGSRIVGIGRESGRG